MRGSQGCSIPSALSPRPSPSARGYKKELLPCRPLLGDNQHHPERIIGEIPRLSEYSLLYCLEDGRTGEPGDHNIPHA